MDVVVFWALTTRHITGTGEVGFSVCDIPKLKIRSVVAFSPLCSFNSLTTLSHYHLPQTSVPDNMSTEAISMLARRTELSLGSTPRYPIWTQWQLVRTGKISEAQKSVSPPDLSTETICKISVKLAMHAIAQRFDPSITYLKSNKSSRNLFLPLDHMC